MFNILLIAGVVLVLVAILGLAHVFALTTSMILLLFVIGVVCLLLAFASGRGFF